MVADIGVSAQNIYQWASDFRKEKKRTHADENNGAGTLQRIHVADQDEPATMSSSCIHIIMETPPRVLVSSGADEAQLRSVLRALSL